MATYYKDGKYLPPSWLSMPAPRKPVKAKPAPKVSAKEERRMQQPHPLVHGPKLPKPHKHAATAQAQREHFAAMSAAHRKEQDHARAASHHLARQEHHLAQQEQARRNKPHPLTGR